jgi:PBSX family phage portal protein
MWRNKAPDTFVKLDADGNVTRFRPGEVLHIKEPDIKQSIYGIPQYFGGIQSVLLSEDSTLFRRKFYINGAHMGYILVTNDANLDDDTAKLIEKQVKNAKGPGNFRSLYLNIPRSTSKEPVQILPVGNIGTKNEFQAIKEVTEMEMLAMRRVYPGLVGIMPANVGGFGDLDKSMRVYHELEVTAMQQVFLQLNEMVGGNPVKFREPVWQAS